MARSFKEGKRIRLVALKPESPQIGQALLGRYRSSTEKIRRRNRSTWSRLMAKRRRQLDKQATADSA